MLVGSRRSVLVHVCSLLDHGQGQARCEEGCCPEGEEVGEEEREEDHEEEVSVQVIDTRVASGSACTAAISRLARLLSLSPGGAGWGRSVCALMA